MKLNANDETYEILEICGQTVLFTSARIARETVPDGLYAYDLRHDDECQGDICEIKPSIAVNHWGTIICKEPIEMNELGYHPVDKEEYNYTEESMTLEDFQEEQSMDWEWR
ncbi:MAG: LPD28 domain-containing protein [Oscillospiraceae bacterium]